MTISHQPRQLGSRIPLTRVHTGQSVELPRASVVVVQLLRHELRQAPDFQLDGPEEAEGEGEAPLQEHAALVVSFTAGVFPVNHDLAHALDLLFGDPAVVPPALAAEAEGVFRPKGGVRGAVQREGLVVEAAPGEG